MTDEELAGPLPEPVRQRVVTLASEALGALPPDEVPASLRPFARFAPSRRAKLAANPIAATLETDPAFRERVAGRLRDGAPVLSAVIENGAPPPAADPLDVAVGAYLLRPPGWVRLVDAARQAVERAAAVEEAGQTRATVRRLEEQLSATRTSGRAEAARMRAELDAARGEIQELRRELREAREQARQSEIARDRASKTADELRASTAREAAQGEAELRRLRSRLAETEATLEASRRAAREGRNMADVRVRLLLDTVLEAAQGLRRELALPPVPRADRPADALGVPTAGAAGPADVARRARDEDDPAVLDQLLALPEVHLVIDGYNVTKAGYASLTLAEQRFRLVGGLAGLAAQSGAEITCVFDGADLRGPVPLAAPRGVRVLFSRTGETADELICRLVRAEPTGRPVVVVSSDREVAEGVRRTGARPVPAAMLLRRLGRG